MDLASIIVPVYNTEGYLSLWSISISSVTEGNILNMQILPKESLKTQ